MPFESHLVRSALALVVTLGLAACESSTSPTVPIDQQFTMAPGDTVEVADTSLQQGQGMHGSFSRSERLR